MRSRHNFYFFTLLFIFLISCKESFEPNLPIVPQGYLVVEGFINAQGPTQIKLSRSTPLDKKKTFQPELNADIKIEGDDNSFFPLKALSNGAYASSTFSLDPMRKYRLRIKTKAGKEYLSDFVAVKITPQIDSVSWIEQDDGVQIFASTHDPQNKSIYYRYDYDETWEIHSAYYASYKVDTILPRQIVIRETNSRDPQIFTCWKYDTSSRIILASSAKLQNDIIYKQPILFIPTQDERIGIRYSVLLRQYALDKEGYEFMEQMRKNTEALGTIFDPQPSALKGNIHSVSDPNEIVIGNVTATTVQEQRIFIAQHQLAHLGFRISSICEEKRVANLYDSLVSVVPPAWPHTAIFEGRSLAAFMVSNPSCVDCRLRKGINVKPSFW